MHAPVTAMPSPYVFPEKVAAYYELAVLKMSQLCRNNKAGTRPALLQNHKASVRQRPIFLHTLKKYRSSLSGRFQREFIGGAEEDRTPDLRIANATLSQLSYRPNDKKSYTRICAADNRARYLDGAPARTHSTTERISASLIRGCAGIGIAPHAPAPPSFTFFDNFATACGSVL